MQFIHDHLIATIVGAILLMVLLTLRLEQQRANVEATQFYAVKKQQIALIDMIERDIENVGSGVPLGEPMILQADAEGLRFRKELADGTQAEVAYLREGPAGTVSLNGTEVPVYHVRRIVRDGDGSWRLAHPQHAQRHRMNAGIIVDSEMVDVRIRGGGRRGGRSLGRVEERFAAMLRPGDTFAFAGLTLEVEQLRDMEVIVRASKKSAMIPSYGGQRLPLTTHLASRGRELLVDRAGWARFPDEVREWLEVQDWRSSMPGPGTLLVESFPHAGREYSVFYTFEGWNANQSLGMLITRRMEDRGLSPIGFIANDYSLAVWGLKRIEDPRAMLSPDILADEFVDHRLPALAQRWIVAGLSGGTGLAWP